MRKFFLLLSIAQAVCIVCTAQIKLQNLRVENLTNPIGLDVAQPRFSWQLVSDKRNTLQTAYEIIVEGLGKSKVATWGSGKITSSESVQVMYAGNALQSGQRYVWQVRVWDNSGKVSAWSEPAFWQTALFNTADWKAKWIQPGYTEDSMRQASPIFRKQFTTKKNIQKATAYITAHGIYEAQINGSRIGDAYLTPGWTSYNKRLQYQVYDVTNLIKTGSNAIGATLGSGWYRGHLAWEDNKNIYGKDIALLLQLQVTYKDGSTETIVTDDTWKSTKGNIVASEIYDGETVDARSEKTGWAMPGYNDADWNTVKVGAFDFNNLIATYNEPIRKHETFKPVKLITTPKGEKVLDFGQNLVGWVQLKLHGNKGDIVHIYHAEVLDKAGNFYTDNLRAAKATATYILKGNGEEIFEPHFTFFGFRFIKIEGIDGSINPGDFTAIAMYSDMQPTGNFASSNTLINQLQHNIQWGQKGNFLDVPTDCPQRDERLGWTGDAQVFSRTAAYNMGVNNFFSKWLKDVAADQNEDGGIPFVVPNVLGKGSASSAGWADVSTIIPWNMYLAYGDKKILETQYPSMKAWVEYMHTKSKNDLWNTGFHFGDWLFYRPDDDNDGRAAVSDKYLIAQCFYAHSTQLLINTATVLGKTDEVANYTALLKRIKEAFIKEYTTASGRLVSSTQTAYVLALNFDMLPENLRAAAAERLVENIKSYDYHLTTGFLGTPYLCHVLSRFGYTDIGYKLLMQDTYPSWLYPVKMGATTIWERWDGQKPDSSFQTPGMNSFNHYAYGAIGDWMYRVVAGMDTYEDGPGYKHIKIQPHIGGGLTTAAADLQTNYGKLSSHWKVENGQLVFDVEIPANTTATVYIPAADAKSIIESNTPIDAVKEITVKGNESGYVIVELGSGIYHFSVKQ